MILEHSGTDYISHSELADFDFTDNFLGKRSVGTGQDTLSYNDDFTYGSDLSVLGNLKLSGQLQDADGNQISTGGSTSTYVLPAAEPTELGGVYNASGIDDTRNDAVLNAGQVKTAIENIDIPTNTDSYFIDVWVRTPVQNVFTVSQVTSAGTWNNDPDDPAFTTKPTTSVGASVFDVE